MPNCYYHPRDWDYLSTDSLLVAVDPPRQINRNRTPIGTTPKLFPAQDLFLHPTFSDTTGFHKKVQSRLAHLGNIQIVIDNDFATPIGILL